MRPIGILCFALITLTGCVTTNWQHTSITDSSSADKQFKIDDSYCLLVANGSVPMPPIPATPPAATLTMGQVNVRNMSTGESAYGTYTATTVPSGGFAGGVASGMSSGMALGAAMRANQERERIHDACMYRKGWVEADAGTPRAAPSSSKSENAVGAASSLIAQGTPINIPPANDPAPSPATASELVLTCRVGSAHGTADAPGEQFDYQIKITGAKVWHGLFKKDLPLSTSENEYRWQVPFSLLKPSDTSNIVVKGSINRYSGAYTEVLDGDRGVVPWSKGECRKMTQAF